MHKILSVGRINYFTEKALISEVIYIQTSEAVAAVGVQQAGLLKLEIYFNKKGSPVSSFPPGKRTCGSSRKERAMHHFKEAI